MLQQATISDISTIRALAAQIWRQYYPEFISTDQVEYMLGLFYSEAALQRQMAEEGQVFWLILREGGPVGFWAISQKGAGSYFIHKFYIAETGRGLGLGNAVFQEIIQQYPDMRECRLTVNRQNFKSINFYFKIGFKIECCLDMPIGAGFEMNDFQMIYRR